MSSVQPPISPLRVVSDSSPFIALNAIGRLDLLRHLFDVVVVPRAVEKEVKSLSLPLWVTVMDLPTAAPFFRVSVKRSGAIHVARYTGGCSPSDRSPRGRGHGLKVHAPLIPA